MTRYRTAWLAGHSTEHRDHRAEADALAHEAELRRTGHARVVVNAVDVEGDE